VGAPPGSTGRCEPRPADQEEHVKSYEEVMEILEAFDLTRSFRDAGELAGCSHHTVAGWVTKRDRGELPVSGELVERAKLIDPYLPKVEEWVERSKGKIRADVVFDRLVAVGFEGSARTVRRAVARLKANYVRGNRRVYRPWVPEPGMWAQWDWGKGPTVAGRATNLFCAWFGWSRFRVVIPTWDRTLATLIGCLDRAMRAAGGAPTYWLTDNEKTVTIDHVAGVAVRNPTIVAAGHHYGVTIATCVPFDPESKGGVEATVRVAKADLVPTDANLLMRATRSRPKSTPGRIGRRGGHRSRCSPRNTSTCTACLTWATQPVSVRPGGCRGRRRSASAGSPTRSRTPSPMRPCGFVSKATSSSRSTSPHGARPRSPATSCRHRGTR
jgi:transposase